MGPRVSSVLKLHHRAVGICDTKELDVIGGPARRRYFEDADVVESLLPRVEIRVDPVRTQKSIPDRIGVGRFVDVHRVAHGPLAVSILDGPVVGTGHVVDTLVCCARSIEPSGSSIAT